jgi:hypothetical protein
MVSTYTDYRMYSQNTSRSLSRVASEPQVARDTAYFEANIGKVKSVDDFLNNYRLYNYAMKAYGLEDMAYAKAFMRKVLESDPTDSKSFANQLADSRYRTFAAAFQFGSNAPDIQTDDQEDSLIGLYTKQNAATVQSAADDTAYFQSKIATITSVDDLMHDSRLYNFALRAVGLDPGTASASQVRAALTSDLSDPASTANTLGGEYLDLAKSFNFATDGSATAGNAQSSVQTSTMVMEYASTDYAGRPDADAQVIINYFRNNVDGAKSVYDIINDNTFYYLMTTAFGLDPSTTPKDTVLKALESDLSDKNSFANKSGDKRLQDLAASFNIAADGSISTRRLAESLDNASHTAVLYNATVKSDTLSQRNATAETTYFVNTIGSVRTLDQFLADKRLVAYAEKAFGITDKPSTDTLRKALTSDVTDPKSYVNRLAPGYRDLALAFNFDTDGTIERNEPTQLQSKKEAITTADLYARMTMEQEAGDKNEGVRLALYFARKASSLSTPYDVLADKALVQVVYTALDVPSSVSASDIDKQANLIKQRLDVSTLKDPATLNKFLVRFCAMYDMQNTDSQATSPTAILFGNITNGSTSTVGFDTTLVSKLAGMKTSRW